ncbi:glutathione S-transferase T2-like [Panicum miliaceum]|uniref:Glutathione S-transferase T2-like n=1 Tax=Panicum miliaceum TaxID=4540 RepID=A0A3L6SFX6_PANMI|nr:glutathione S-transferase T2-like [Panicum miliaceum]
MSHRSKREVAPPSPQVPAADVPWHGNAVKPNVSSQYLVKPWSHLQPAWWVSKPPRKWPNFIPATQSNPIIERASSSSKGKTVIGIDDGEEVSGWLFHSNDPINGNGKKNDSYWEDVHAHYNSTTPPNRKRKVKHLRDRFQKIKRWIMKDEPKWLALPDELENLSKKKLDDDGLVGDDKKKAEDTSEKECPIGTKEAKKQCTGKRIKDEDTGLDEDMKKYMDIQAAAAKRHGGFLETQQRVSDAKVPKEVAVRWLWTLLLLKLPQKKHLLSILWSG